MLEEKLKRVKEGLYEELKKKELEEGEYWQKTYELLLKEGIVEGSFEEDTMKLTVRLATMMTYKLPTVFHFGLEKKHIALKKSKLSPETIKDLQKYSDVYERTKEHMEKRVGQTQIFRSDYEKMVEDYVSSQEEVRAMRDENRRDTMYIRIATEMDTNKLFNIRKDPEKLGRYDAENISDAMDKI